MGSYSPNGTSATPNVEKAANLFDRWDEDELCRQEWARDCIDGILIFPDAERLLVAAFGARADALLLHQLIYWFRRPRMEDRWTLWKTYPEWKSERGLGRRAVDGARRRLVKMGILEEAKGWHSRVHYRLNWHRLAVLLGLVEPEEDDADRPPGRPEALTTCP